MVIYREFKELKSLAAPVHWPWGCLTGCIWDMPE